MGSNTKQLCRVCFQTSNDVINIWETFLDSTIASILVKHFWFQVQKNDGLTESICEDCWMQTKTFHEFYNQVERFQKCFWNSISRDTSVPHVTIHIDRYTDIDLEADLNIVKCEEVEVEAETPDWSLSTHNSSKYDKDHTSNENNMKQSVDDEDQCSSNADSDRNDQTLKSNAEISGRLSLSKELQLDGQIRDLFNMNCEICSDVKFKNWLQARQHYRKVHEIGGYLTCCDKKFHTRGDVLEHLRYHVNLTVNGSSEAKIRDVFAMKCEICSDITDFVTLLEVRQHYRKVHKTTGYLICCKKKFYRRVKMLEHVRCHTNCDMYTCDICSRRFTRRDAIRKHMETHLPPVSHPFRCSLCPRSFLRKGGLTSHMEYKHAPNDGEKYSCNTCGKNFRSSLQLSSHIRGVHLITKSVCEVCARKFASKSALQYHIDNVHSTTPTPKVQCEICGRWSQKRSMSKHRKLHIESKPVNCTICNRTLTNELRLRNHVQRVHGERRHQCQLCGKKFIIAKNLKEHLAVHTGEDLYDCAYCEKKFKSNANMYSHRKKAHLAEWTRDNKRSK